MIEASLPCPTVERIFGRRPDLNVSMRQLEVPGIADQVQGALTYSRLPAQDLTLEITKSALSRETDAVLETLARLQAMGVRLGWGHSTLEDLETSTSG